MQTIQILRLPAFACAAKLKTEFFDKGPGGSNFLLQEPLFVSSSVLSTLKEPHFAILGRFDPSGYHVVSDSKNMGL